MKWWHLFCYCLIFSACSVPPASPDPRSLLTPREVYLLFALEYEDEVAPRWKDLGPELSHLEAYGLLEQFTLRAQGSSPMEGRIMLTSKGDYTVQRLGWVAEFHEHPNLRANQAASQPIVIPFAEDLPLLEGEKGFVGLTKQQGKESGEGLAKLDFGRGFYRILVYDGSGASFAANSEFFLQQYGIFVYPIARRSVTEGVIGVAEGYNLVMRGLLAQKFHQDLLEKALHAERPMALAVGYLTCREMYLLGDLALGIQQAPQWYEFVPELKIMEASGLIKRDYQEEARNNYHFPCATLTARGKSLVRWLGWNEPSYD